MIYLYLKTHNTTGLKYLGKTTQDPFKYKGSGIHWKAHLKKHGNDVTTEILFQTEDKELFKEVALEYSYKYNIVESREFANMTLEEGQGGNTWDKRGRFISEEQKEKIRLGNLGVKRSEKTKSKMRKPKSETHKHNMKKPKTEEHKLKMKEKVKCPHCGYESTKTWVTIHLNKGICNNG